MKISVLGPLEVLRDGSLATPSAPKLRRVLSLLVMRANSVVRNEQIVDELWEDNPPISVTTTLQTYIYQLRKLLRLHAPERLKSPQAAPFIAALHSFPNGYMLSLEPDALDAHVFESLAQRGQSLLESGDVQESADALAEALALWRGSVLVDVAPGPLLQAEVLRLEEIRKSALELRVEADLRLGRHHSLLGELTRLVAQQPTHEGFQAKLMLALYRSGRRSEALHVYQRARQVLAAELGLDPSRDIKRLHQAVLTSDRALDLEPTGTQTTRQRSASSLPHHARPSAHTLVGRDTTISEITSALRPREGTAPAPLVVLGPPGSGKSALCAHTAHQVADSFPDGQLIISLIDGEGNAMSAGEALSTVLHRVGTPSDDIPATTEERADLFRSWTARRKALFVFDDLVDEHQVSPLLPSGHGCAVLLASRRRLSLTNDRTTIDLAPLCAAESLSVLSNALGKHRTARDATGAQELVELCGGLPLTLHAVASRLQLRPHWSLGRAARWLKEEQKAPTDNTDPLGLRTSVERTYRRVPESVRSAFRELATVGHELISISDAANALGTDEHTAESLLEELAEVRLIEIESVAGNPTHFQYRFSSHLQAVGRQFRNAESEPLGTN